MKPLFQLTSLIAITTVPGNHTMTNSKQAGQRLYYLDAARAFALILGVIFHASISFMPIFIGWAVMDISTSSIVPVFMMISHSFRLELFFLIAGFFSHMKFHQEGTQQFLKSRLVRIAIPFLLGWIVLRPLLVSGWTIGAQSMRGDADILAGLKTGFAILGELPKDLLVGTHLWFLYYLLVISFSLLLLYLAIGLVQPFKRKLENNCDSAVTWISRSRFGIFAIALPTASCLWFLSNWGMDTPDKSLVPHLPALLTYGGFYFFGWLLHRNKEVIEDFAQISCGKVAFCLMAIVSCNLLSRFEMGLAHPQYLWFKAGFAISYAFMMWSLVSLVIGLFKRILDRPSKIVRYIADSSYWLYLIHLPIVIWLQIAFAELNLHWSLKLTSICILTILISIAIYDLCIRSTLIGKILNGKRKQRCLSLKF